MACDVPSRSERSAFDRQSGLASSRLCASTSASTISGHLTTNRYESEDPPDPPRGPVEASVLAAFGIAVRGVRSFSCCYKEDRLTDALPKGDRNV